MAVRAIVVDRVVADETDLVARFDHHTDRNCQVEETRCGARCRDRSRPRDQSWSSRRTSPGRPRPRSHAPLGPVVADNVPDTIADGYPYVKVGTASQCRYLRYLGVLRNPQAVPHDDEDHETGC